MNRVDSSVSLSSLVSDLRPSNRATKYSRPLPVDGSFDRQWPSRTLSKAPLWLSTDLRDGNQALANPMTVAQKWTYYHLLVSMGFKQIEVSFPTASDTEFEFTRALVTTPGAIPDDVTIEVLAPCRIDALTRAVESVRGAPRAIIFTFLTSSDNHRDTVLLRSEEQLLVQARECVEHVRALTKDDPTASVQTEWRFGFGLEDFGSSRPAAALRLAETVIQAWQPSVAAPVILGLATSVERFMPNVYADQVETFARGLGSDRDRVCISLHTHNDRGGAVASAELGCLAGADRVEGCLFGNGERAGNCDLVTMALNMLTQGIDPGLDFSFLPEVRKVYERITGIPVHPRNPYAGDLYFRAFSGGHQDAIRKGFVKRRDDTDKGKGAPPWRVPYLPMDPADVGRSMDCVIGINSQSGKSGVAWTISHQLGIDISPDVAVAFSKVIKSHSDKLGRELNASEVGDLFRRQYGTGHMPDRSCTRSVEKTVPLLSARKTHEHVSSKVV